MTINEFWFWNKNDGKLKMGLILKGSSNKEKIWLGLYEYTSIIIVLGGFYGKLFLTNSNKSTVAIFSWVWFKGLVQVNQFSEKRRGNSLRFFKQVACEAVAIFTIFTVVCIWTALSYWKFQHMWWNIGCKCCWGAPSFSDYL